MQSNEGWYEIEKTFEISARHHLTLDYPSKCANSHGHNWIVKIFLHADKLNKNGMILDFTEIKSKVHDKPLSNPIWKAVLGSGCVVPKTG